MEDSFRSNLKMNQEWVQVLINLRMKYARQFTGKKNSANVGWKLIHNEIQQEGAPKHLTVAKLKKKWMNLMTRYKQIKNNRSSNNITWIFFEQIDKAFGAKFAELSNTSIKEKTVNEENPETNKTEQLNEILENLKKIQEKQHLEIMEVLNNIQNSLKTN